MKVWGADDVEAAAAAGTSLRVGPRDLVTPLARERAQELEVAVETAGTSAGPRTPSAPPPSATIKGLSLTSPRGAARGGGQGRADVNLQRPPQAALYRRGIPLPAGVRVAGRQREPGDASPGPPAPTSTTTPATPATSGPRRGRVVVVGAGHVGVIAALRLTDADIFEEVVLVDVVEGLAAGVALDLAHSAAIGGGPAGSGFGTRVRGVASVEDAGPADYVVVTAGRARQPGMTRGDLVGTNAAIVGDVARRVARTSPGAVVVVVTNPLDEMAYHAWRSTGFPAHRVIGMAGVLDSARFRSLVSEQSWLPAGTTAADVDALALGSHGEEMVVPLSVATVGGAAGRGAGRSALTDLVPPARLGGVVERTRASGAEVVSLLRTGSAYLTPGTAAARMVLAMTRDTGELLPAAVLPQGAYGITDELYVGLPARLGRDGVREVVELPLSDAELSALRDAAARIHGRLADLPALQGS